MKIDISCSGGTTRTLHLAAELDKKGLLGSLFVHMYGKKNRLQKRLFGSLRDESQDIDLRKVRTNFKFNIIYKFLGLTRLDKLLRINTRLLYCRLIDADVAAALDGSSDILVAESNFALVSIKRAKKLGMVTVLDRTNTHVEFQSEILEEEYRRLGIRYVFNTPEVVRRALQEYLEADYICVLSNFVKQTFIQKGVSSEKLLVVPTGVNTKQFTPTPKKDSVFRIITAATFCVKKSTYYLLEAFRSLKLKNAELWLIGDVFEDIVPEFKKYEGEFKHLGIVPHAQMPYHFSQGSVFVSTSIEEGIPKVMLEAMACELPVIATPNTVAHDVFTNGVEGFITPARDVAALKEKILYLYEHPQVCAEMGRRARERALENFDWSHYAERMFKTYQTIVTLRNRQNV